MSYTDRTCVFLAIMFYVRLCAALNRYNIRYLLVGDAAMTLHGLSCMTMVIDVAVDASVDQSLEWAKVHAELAAKPSDPKINLLSNREWDFSEMWMRRQKFVVRGVEVALSSARDLIAMKEATGHPKDGRDIKYLNQTAKLTNLEAADAWHPADDMICDADYELSKEELARSLAPTPLQRLEWLDEARQFILLARMAMRRNTFVG